MTNTNRTPAEIFYAHLNSPTELSAAQILVDVLTLRDKISSENPDVVFETREGMLEGLGLTEENLTDALAGNEGLIDIHTQAQILGGYAIINNVRPPANLDEYLDSVDNRDVTLQLLQHVTHVIMQIVGIKQTYSQTQIENLLQDLING